MIGEGSSSSSPSDTEALEATASYLALIASFALQDIDDVSATRKGKRSAQAPKSDEELAFELFAEEAHSLLSLTQDMTFAQSLDDALRADHDILQEVLQEDEVARSDREYASALQEGRTPATTSASSFTQAAASYKPSLTNNTASLTVSLGKNSVDTRSSSMTTLTPATASSSRTQFQSVYKAYSDKRKKEMCVFCRENIGGHQIQAPCGHFWDADCLADLFRASTTDESLFPPRCCQQPFVLKEVERHLMPELLASFNAISLEFRTADRVYCHRPTCSAFIGPATESSSAQDCPKCLAQTCGHCKERAHSGSPCITDDAPILALAEQNGWARCPGCKHIVELAMGCYHMTCRCGKQFCYICVETWKNCLCPQWDEPRLLITAQDRVQRELPAGPPPAAPLLQEMVRRAADRLRVDHDCQHMWRYRPGGGRCEQCSYYLPVFLLVRVSIRYNGLLLMMIDDRVAHIAV
ncbi:uncharacterized protein B0H18DRAFT_347537 [Fomitopsis serialis]|uniref:uncharacterized protein n=1 Tax=Fomitopsis serialis TaxID=139415 RepID=UPI002008868B|nr:uncharacterized protein B0H18DRAFT_347537 [Neoantrodia serialis]KAH9911610.1 hypothetical protein B0H18DRAFT_347537 [Neoantrodia serialis]